MTHKENIKAILECYFTGFKEEIIDSACNRLLEQQSKTEQWIPVSEGLPKPRIDVWCDSDMGQMVGYYEEHIKTWYGRDYLELMVTAWMPLPKSYRVDSQESEETDADSN